jgi:hypothetical protein
MADSLSQAKIQDITQGEGAGRLGAAGQVLQKGLNLTPSGIANTGRNISNVISPRYTPAEQALIKAAKTPGPTLSTKYSKPFQALKAGQQQMADSAGEMQPMQYGPTTPNQEYEAYLKSQQPSGNTPFPKDVASPMTPQLTPSERMQAAGNVYQRVANKPATPALDAAKSRYQSATNSPAGDTLRQLKGAKTQGNMSGTFPDLGPSLAKEATTQSNEEVQSLLQQGYNAQQIRELGYPFKRGGRVLTPAQISLINKTAKRTRTGRKVA